MEVQNKNNGHKGFFFIEDDAKEIALMHYVLAGAGKMIIDHTEVDEAYEGRGLGRQLVKAGVNYARDKKLKIQPDCEFARKVFDNTPEYADVLVL